MKRNITQYIENNSNDHEKNLHYNKKYKCDILDKKRKNIQNDEIPNKKIKTLKKEEESIYFYDINDYNYNINNKTNIDNYSYIK